MDIPLLSFYPTWWNDLETSIYLKCFCQSFLYSSYSAGVRTCHNVPLTPTAGLSDKDIKMITDVYPAIQTLPTLDIDNASFISKDKASTFGFYMVSVERTGIP
jgi:hypothetical protein